MLESIRISLHGWMQLICDACHCLWRKFWISVSNLWNSAGIWVEAVNVQFCLTWISLYENGNRFVTDGIRCVIFFLSHLLLYNYNIRKNWLYVTDNLAHSIAKLYQWLNYIFYTTFTAAVDSVICYMYQYMVWQPFCQAEIPNSKFD